MSKFAILKTIRRGAWTVDGEITVNVDLVAAIEEETGSGGQCTQITLTGGRAVCVQGDQKAIRRALVKLSTGGEPKPRSLWEEVFGHKANER